MEIEMIDKINNDIIDYLDEMINIKSHGVSDLDSLLQFYKETNDVYQTCIVFFVNDFGIKYYDSYHDLQKDLINIFIEILESLDEDYVPDDIELVNQLQEDLWLDQQWELYLQNQPENMELD